MFKSVIQVIPKEDYTVYVYFSTGEIKLYNARHLLEKGVFRVLEDMEFFMKRCTVMNGTLAWDRSGNYNEYDCIDIDPDVLYKNSVSVKDPLERSA